MAWLKTKDIAEYVKSFYRTAALKIKLEEGERNLGMTVDNELSFRKHIRVSTAKANSVVGVLKNAFVCRDVDNWKNMYVSLVRTHLEHAASVWKPRLY